MLGVNMILMAARRRGRGRHGANPVEKPTRGADAFIAVMNTMAEAVHETATATTRVIDRLGERNGDRNGGLLRGGDGNDNKGAGSHDNPMTLATFLKVNPTKFKGMLVATKADNWFRGIEKSLQAQHEVEEIDCGTFKEEVYKKYFSKSVCDAKEMELMKLKQGNMSVIEYTWKFEDLYRFSKIFQGSPDDFEEWKCLKYEGSFAIS
ncbi:hypothetical protein AHAS_Ahas05G0150700 [Arachis hypogaea]